jgi:hypothetical protein
MRPKALLMRGKSWKFAVVATSCIAIQITSPVPAHADAHHNAAVITQWNAIAVRTVFTENSTPVPSSGLFLGFVSLAVYDAVVAIAGGYEPYLRQPRADRKASTEAAAATAAHDVLVHYFPASATNLAADYAATLATIPNGRGKVGGQRVGANAAAQLIRLRSNDGRNAPITLDVAPAPGVWRPRPDALAQMLVPWLGFVRPLALRSTPLPVPGPPPRRTP